MPPFQICKQSWVTNLSIYKHKQRILKGAVSLYHWPPVWLVWNQLYDNWQFFCFYLQNRLIQTSQTGDWWYSDTSPFSIPWLNPWNFFNAFPGGACLVSLCAYHHDPYGFLSFFYLLRMSSNGTAYSGQLWKGLKVKKS